MLKDSSNPNGELKEDYLKRKIKEVTDLGKRGINGDSLFKGDHPGLYIMVNFITNHCYVGQSENIRARKNRHVHDLKAGTHHNGRIREDSLRNGSSDFAFGILHSGEDFSDKDFRLKLEREYFDILDDQEIVNYNDYENKEGGRLYTEEGTERRIEILQSFKGPDALAKRTLIRIGQEYYCSISEAARETNESTSKIHAWVNYLRKNPNYRNPYDVEILDKEALPEAYYEKYPSDRLKFPPKN